MTYTVRPITQFALMRDGQATPVAVYSAEQDAKAAIAMLAEYVARVRKTRAPSSLSADLHPFSDLA